MDVRCRKCGASVAPDIAFCPECGAVMAEAAEEHAPEKKSPLFESTLMPGRAPGRDPAPAPPREPQKRAAPPAPAERAAAAPAVAQQEQVRSRSSAYVVIGLAAVVLLGALFIYLLSVILSR